MAGEGEAGSVEARALKRVLSVPRADRRQMLAEGLGLLAEHVRELRSDAEHLIAAGRNRAAGIVEAVAQEEAAKVVILLDLARLGWRDDAAAGRLVGAFYSHLARGIYVSVVGGSPAGLREVRNYVETLRASHHLDGPNDFDWIFRNEIEAHREELFYVDYVNSDDGPLWLTPASRDELPLWSVSRIVDLAVSLDLTGLLSVEGLGLVEETWRDVDVVDGTHWSVIRAANVDVLNAAQNSGLFSPDLGRSDLELVLEHWTFPLYGLDLTRVKVREADLRDRQSRAYEAFQRDTYGDW